MKSFCSRAISNGKTALLLLLLVSFLTSCASFEREIRLQNWESSQPGIGLSESKSSKRRLLTRCRKSVKAAEAFGEADFRLGLSLRSLGDAQWALGNREDAESSFKRSVEVLCLAEKKAEKQLSSNVDFKEKSVERNLIVEDIADSFSRLGELYADEGKFQQASLCFGFAAPRYKSLLQSEKSDQNDFILGQKCVSALLSLARASASTQKIDEAVPSYLWALELASKSCCNEYQLREMRDEYLAFLKKYQRKDYMDRVLADVSYCRYTAEGMRAMSHGDYSLAERMFREARMQSVHSLFSARRVPRALLNLITALVRGSNLSEVEHCAGLVDNVFQSYPQMSPGDYDQIQEILANYFFVTGKYTAGRRALSNQYVYRVKKFGVKSREVASLCALMGLFDYQLGRLDSAERMAMLAFKNVDAHPSSKSFVDAVSKTADLMQALGKFEQAELLDKRLISIRQSEKGSADPGVISERVRLLLLYKQFKRRKEAEVVIGDIVSALSTAESSQRAASFSSVVLAVTACLTCDWYDLSQQLVQLGKSILEKDMGGVCLEATVSNSWENDLIALNNHKSAHRL